MNFAPDGVCSQLALDYGVGDHALVSNITSWFSNLCIQSLSIEADHSGNFLLKLQAGFSLTLGIPQDDRFFDDKADIAEINGYGDTWTWILRPDQAVRALVLVLHTDAALVVCCFGMRILHHMCA